MINRPFVNTSKPPSPTSKILLRLRSIYRSTTKKRAFLFIHGHLYRAICIFHCPNVISVGWVFSLIYCRHFQTKSIIISQEIILIFTPRVKARPGQTFPRRSFPIRPILLRYTIGIHHRKSLLHHQHHDLCHHQSYHHFHE